MSIRELYPIKPFEEKLESLLLTIKKEKPLILIQGGYGKNNLGDDALLLTIQQKILTIRSDADIVAVCHYPSNVKSKYGINAVYFTERTAIKYFFTCDALIIGGGDIVNKINTFSGYRFFKIFDPKGKYLFFTSLLTRLRRKIVVFYVVGMTSIPDKAVELLMRITLPKADLLGIRDMVTYETIVPMVKGKSDIIVCHDPALDFHMQMELDMDSWLKDKNVQPETKMIIVSVRHVLNDRINANLINSIKLYIEYIDKYFQDYQVLLLPVSQHPDKKLENDLIISSQVFSKLSLGCRAILISEYLHPQFVKELFGRADLILMARLHGLILSYDFHRPTIVLSYDNKVTQFAKMAGYKSVLPYESISFERIKELSDAELSAKNKIERR